MEMSVGSANTGGSPTKLTTVAIAVKSGSGSRRAVRWVVENLKADRFVLVHVMPAVTSIPTPSFAALNCVGDDYYSRRSNTYHRNG